MPRETVTIPAADLQPLESQSEVTRSVAPGSRHVTPEFLEGVKQALQNPDKEKLEEATRHSAAKAVLNYFEDMKANPDSGEPNRLREGLELLESEKLYKGWGLEDRLTLEEWREEARRWANAAPHREGRRLGYTFLTEQAGFNLPALPDQPRVLLTDTADTEPLTIREAIERLADAEDQEAAATEVFRALIRYEATAITVDETLKVTRDITGIRLGALRQAFADEQRAQKPPAARKTSSGVYAEHNGVLCRVEEHKAGKDDLVLVHVPLCNFTCWITAEIERNDGEEAVIIYMIEGRTASGHPLPPLEVPARQFPAMNWVAEWGSRAVLNAGMGVKDHARAAIQQLSEPEYRNERTHTGFARVNGHDVYVTAGGRIAATEDAPDIGVSLTGELSKYEPVAPRDQAEAAAALRASMELLKLAPAKVMAPLLMITYRAALDRTTFSGHIAGRTGVGKTQLAALMQQHYGAAMDASALPASWTSTANYLEAQAYYLKDALMVVDEFNDAARLNATAERVMRAQGNTSGRGRMNPDGTLKSIKTPRGTILSTGEDLPSGHSLRARILTIELEPDA